MDEDILKGGLPERRRSDLTGDRFHGIADELVSTRSLDPQRAIDQCGLAAEAFAKFFLQFRWVWRLDHHDITADALFEGIWRA